MAWTDETKQAAINAYLQGGPTPENSTELVKQIAEDMEESPNGVRMILTQAKVYVKKEAATSAAKTTSGNSAAGGDKAPRVSKESQIAELRAAIEAKGGKIDDDVLSKLTGKAAAYFVAVLAA